MCECTLSKPHVASGQTQKSHSGLQLLLSCDLDYLLPGTGEITEMYS